jgi:L-rhamnose-H+ transport protein
VAFKTGEPQMGSQSYVGWAVLMASSIMFSGALGLILGEWKGTSVRTRSLLGLGLVVLLGSAVLSGYSGALGQKAASNPAPAAVEPASK